MNFNTFYPFLNHRRVEERRQLQLQHKKLEPNQSRRKKSKKESELEKLKFLVNTKVVEVQKEGAIAAKGAGFTNFTPNEATNS